MDDWHGLVSMAVFERKEEEEELAADTVLWQSLEFS